MALEWLDEIERRANAATPGPWEARESWVYPSWIYPGIWWVAQRGDRCFSSLVFDGTVTRQADAEFVAHARTDVPRLCRAVRELHVALREVLDAYSDMARLEEWVEDAPEPPPALERAQHRFMEARQAAKRVLERWDKGGD